MQSVRLVVWTLVAISVIAAIGFLSSTSPERKTEPSKALFITGGTTPFWQLSVAGAKAAAKEYKVELTVELPEKGHSQQSEILSSIEPGQYSGVALSPRAPQKQKEILQSLASRVALVTFDSDAPGSDRLCYIGTDNYTAGRLAAQLTLEAVPDGGKVALLVATFEKDNAVLRSRGYREEMQRASLLEEEEDAAEFEILEPLEDGIDREKAKENIKNTLSQHPDLAAFVGMFSYHGPVLLEALADIPAEERPQLIVFDEEKAVLEGLVDGEIYATVVQDPFKYGYESVRMLAALQSGKTMELPIAGGGSLYLPCEAITPDKVESFKKRYESRLSK